MRFYFYAVIAALFAGTTGLFVKLIGEEVHFMTLTFYRVFIAFLFLLLIVPFVDKKAFKASKKDIKNYFFVGLLLALAIGTFTLANVFAPIQNAVLLSSISPFFVLILGSFFLKEKITKTKIFTLLLAVVGLFIINPFQFGSNAIGNMLALSNGLFYSIYIIWAKKQDVKHEIGDVVWFFFFASLFLLPFPLIFGFGNIEKVLVFVVLIGLLSTALQHLFTNFALQRVEAEVESIIKMVIAPLVAIILAFLVINEPLNFRVILGGAILILAGIYLETHRKVARKK